LNIVLILSWGKASNRIQNTSLLFRGLSLLLMDYVVPSVYVTELGVPDSEIDRKRNKYD
jgi:hypothetical protein